MNKKYRLTFSDGSSDEMETDLPLWQLREQFNATLMQGRAFFSFSDDRTFNLHFLVRVDEIKDDADPS